MRRAAICCSTDRGQAALAAWHAVGAWPARTHAQRAGDSCRRTAHLPDGIRIFIPRAELSLPVARGSVRRQRDPSPRGPSRRRSSGTQPPRPPREAAARSRGCAITNRLIEGGPSVPPPRTVYSGRGGASRRPVVTRGSHGAARPMEAAGHRTTGGESSARGAKESDAKSDRCSPPAAVAQVSRAVGHAPAAPGQATIRRVARRRAPHRQSQVRSVIRVRYAGQSQAGFPPA